MNLLGIDIGGTKIAGGVVDGRTGRVLIKDRVPTEAAEGGAAVLARALGLARSLADAARTQGVGAPVAVGVGAGGQIDPDTGVVASATDLLPGWTGTPLRDAFAGGLGIDAAVDNDVNALAIGECRFGAGVGARHLVFLALGTGVGGALVVDGRLYHGARGVGGEVGHLLLFPEGRAASGDDHVLLEDYTSGGALVRHYRALGGPADRDGVAVGEEALRDPGGVGARAVAHLGECLGLGLASLANLFDPERFVVGGGLADLDEMLLAPARRVLYERALPIVRATPVVRAALGPDAAVIGAASLALPPRIAD